MRGWPLTNRRSRLPNIMTPISSTQADSPTSEPNPHCVGHTWDATLPSIDPLTVTAGHRP